MALLKCTDLFLAYDGVTVAEDISFEVNDGDYLCIIGENGSGKTSLMKAILGLLKPSGGSIEFGDGLERSHIGYLPQQTDIQRDFPASVGEVVISGALARMGRSPFYTAEARKLASDNMALLGISDLAKHCYNELSGGQQQRVLLARALCASRRLLLLDEPVSGLDPVVTAEMYDIIRRLNRENGVAVIMISHDVAAITGDCTHILHLHHRVEFFGAAADYHGSRAAQSFLGRNPQ